MPNIKVYKKLIETEKKLLNEYKIDWNKNPMIRFKERGFRGGDVVLSDGKKVATITCR